jgi:hypothetical protein
VKKPERFPDQMSVYHWYAESYHWSPRVVDELSIEQDFWLRAQKEALNAAEATLAREAEVSS